MAAIVERSSSLDTEILHLAETATHLERKVGALIESLDNTPKNETSLITRLKSLRKRSHDHTLAGSPRVADLTAAGSDGLASIKIIKNSIKVFYEYLVLGKDNKSKKIENITEVLKDLQSGFDTLVTYKCLSIGIKKDRKPLYKIMNVIKRKWTAEIEHEKELRRGWRHVRNAAEEQYNAFIQVLRIPLLFTVPPQKAPPSEIEMDKEKLVVKEQQEKNREDQVKAKRKEKIFERLIYRSNNVLSCEEHKKLSTVPTKKLLVVYRSFLDHAQFLEYISKGLKSSKVKLHQKINLLRLCRKWVQDKNNRQYYFTEVVLATLKAIVTTAEKNTELKKTIGQLDCEMIKEITSGKPSSRRLSQPPPPPLDNIIPPIQLPPKIWIPPKYYASMATATRKLYLKELQSSLFAYAARVFYAIDASEWISFKKEASLKESRCKNICNAIKAFEAITSFAVKEILYDLSDFENIETLSTDKSSSSEEGPDTPQESKKNRTKENKQKQTTYEDIEKEVKARYNFFVDLAIACLEHKNYFGMMAIGTMLGSNPFLSRIVKQFNIASSNNILKINELTSPNHNFKALRTEIDKQKGSLIPFIGIITKDLEALLAALENRVSLEVHTTVPDGFTKNPVYSPEFDLQLINKSYFGHYRDNLKDVDKATNGIQEYILSCPPLDDSYEEFKRITNLLCDTAQALRSVQKSPSTPYSEQTEELPAHTNDTEGPTLVRAARSLGNVSKISKQKRRSLLRADTERIDALI